MRFARRIQFVTHTCKFPVSPKSHPENVQSMTLSRTGDSLFLSNSIIYFLFAFFFFYDLIARRILSLSLGSGLWPTKHYRQKSQFSPSNRFDLFALLTNCRGRRRNEIKQRKIVQRSTWRLLFRRSRAYLKSHSTLCVFHLVLFY